MPVRVEPRLIVAGQPRYRFSQIRRWATRQKAAFFSLSPSERNLVDADEAHRKVKVAQT